MRLSIHLLLLMMGTACADPTFQGYRLVGSQEQAIQAVVAGKLTPMDVASRLSEQGTAERILLKALVVSPRSRNACRLALAEIYLSQCDYMAAETALSLCPMTAQNYFLQGQLQYAMGEYADAAQRWHLADLPESPILEAASRMRSQPIIKLAELQKLVSAIGALPPEVPLDARLSVAEAILHATDSVIQLESGQMIGPGQAQRNELAGQALSLLITLPPKDDIHIQARVAGLVCRAHQIRSELKESREYCANLVVDPLALVKCQGRAAYWMSEGSSSHQRCRRLRFSLLQSELAGRRPEMRRSYMRGCVGLLRALVDSKALTWPDSLEEIFQHKGAAQRITWGPTSEQRAMIELSCLRREALHSRPGPVEKLERMLAQLATARAKPLVGLIPKLQAKLKPDEAVLEFIDNGIDPEQDVIVITCEGIETQSLLPPPRRQDPIGVMQEELEKFGFDLGPYFTQLALDGGLAEEDTSGAMAWTNGNMWKRLEPKIPTRCRKLYVSLDRPYSLYPLSLAYDQSKAQFLCERYQISHVNSAADLALSPRGQPIRPRSVLLLGNPAYGLLPGHPPDYPQLPTFGEELNDLVEVLRNNGVVCKPFAGEEADRKCLANIGHYDALHIITHGFYNKDSKLSGLALAGANRGSEGILWSTQVSKIDLTKTPLVSLSACETAIGPAAPLEGVHGMASEFLQAGARTVICSLTHTVGKPEQMTLMREFYARLCEDAGGDPIAAFCSVQNEEIQKASSETMRLVIKNTAAYIVVTRELR